MTDGEVLRMPYMVTAASGIRGYTEGELLREEDERLATLYPRDVMEITEADAQRLAGIDAGSPQELQRARAAIAREIVAAQGPREARPAEGPVAVASRQSPVASDGDGGDGDDENNDGDGNGRAGT